MAAYNVRVFGYQGVREIPRLNPKQFASDAIQVNDEPPLWSQVLPMVSGSAAVASTISESPDGATIVVIEIPDGQAIRYELQPTGPTATNARTPGNLSRRMAGTEAIAWTNGAILAIVDAGAFP